MAELRFDWNPRKAAESRRKHRVSFEEAQTAFLDEEALVIEDPDHSASEDRFILLGVSAGLRVLFRVPLHSRRWLGDPDHQRKARQPA